MEVGKPFKSLIISVMFVYLGKVKLISKTTTPWSIVSTPAGRGRGPFRPISPMELQAEQLIKAFLLLMSLTEETKSKQDAG